MQCPSCGKESEGRYCASCGAPLSGAICARCGGQLVAGARFCTHCGENVRRGGERAALPMQQLAWIIAGLAVIGIVVVSLPIWNRAAAPAGGGFAPPAGAPAMGTPPPLSASPRENADRLFNRVMTDRESGNTQQLTFLTDMAVDAYRMAEPLDSDGLYHLSVLETANGEPEAARATAERILASSPTHLLALAAAADASLQTGDTAAARTFFQTFIDAYDTEREKALPEYRDHAQVLPGYLETARTIVSR